MPSYIIADVTSHREITQTIYADSDEDARRLAHEYLKTRTNVDSVTLFVCEGTTRVVTLVEIHRES